MKGLTGELPNDFPDGRVAKVRVQLTEKWKLILFVKMATI